MHDFVPAHQRQRAATATAAIAPYRIWVGMAGYFVRLKCFYVLHAEAFFCCVVFRSSKRV